MKFYQKYASILMIAGFVSLAAGVFLSVQLQLRTLSYTLVVIGLLIYITGRIGIYTAPARKAERTGVEDDEDANEKNIDETKRNKIEI